MLKLAIRSCILSIFAVNRNSMKRVFFILLLIILLLLSGVLYFFESLERSYSGEHELLGLSGEVKVYHDEYAIPHIYAERSEDAFRALGYLHAADRLFQLDMLRRIGGGELSELLGSELIDADKYLRTIGLSQQAKNATLRFSALSNDELKKEISAYIEGVNAYIDENNRPIE
jgi:penicillin amidase